MQCYNIKVRIAIIIIIVIALAILNLLYSLPLCLKIARK